MSPLQQRAVEAAQAEIGVREATGQNDGTRVRFFQRFIAPWMERQPWCVAFAIWCVHRAAHSMGRESRLPKTGSSSTLFGWFRKEKLVLAHPVAGCIGMVRKGRTTGSDAAGGVSHSHTFIVVGVEGGWVLGIDGNYKNAVARSRRPIGDCDYGQIV